MFRNHITRVLGAASIIATVLSTHALAGGDLFIYNWTDYTAPELIKKFEKETGINVTIDTYDSNETVLAKLRTGASYDIVVVSSYFVPVFAEQGLLKEIDAPSLADYNNIDGRWRSPEWDKGNKYTVPWQWGVTAFSINTDKIKQPVDSYKFFFEPPPELNGKIGMMSTGGDNIFFAQIYLGMGPCQTDTGNMKKVEDVLVKQAPAVKVYNTDGILERQVSGETWMSLDFNGNAMRERLANPAIKFIYPKEGVFGWMDNVAVPAKAKNPENAKKFIEFLLKPENIALQTAFTKYASGISASKKYLDPDFVNAPEQNLPEGTKIMFAPACSSEALKLIDRVWTRVKK